MVLPWDKILSTSCFINRPYSMLRKVCGPFKNVAVLNRSLQNHIPLRFLNQTHMSSYRVASLMKNKLLKVFRVSFLIKKPENIVNIPYSCRTHQGDLISNFLFINKFYKFEVGSILFFYT